MLLLPIKSAKVGLDNSGFGGVKTNGVTIATQWGAQNSENLGFAGFLPGFNANNQHLYEVTLQAKTLDGSTLVGSVSAFADARTPEPATWSLLVMGLGLVGIGKRYRK